MIPPGTLIEVQDYELTRKGDGTTCKDPLVANHSLVVWNKSHGNAIVRFKQYSF